MEDSFFSVLLPYEGKWNIAHVKKLPDQLNLAYFIDFLSGYRNVFISTDDDLWIEETLGATSLSKEVGRALDKYLLTQYPIEPCVIVVDNEKLIVQAVDEKLETQYEIFKDGDFLFTLKITEYATWEPIYVAKEEYASREYVKKIADEIEAVNE